MKHTPNLMTATIHTKRRAYKCIVDKYSGNRYRVVVGPSFLADKEFQFNHGLSNRSKIDFKEMLGIFGYYYSLLYREHKTYESEMRECARVFDNCWKDPAFAKLATDFCDYRKDLMISDRECAAFIMMLRELFIPEIVTTKNNISKQTVTAYLIDHGEIIDRQDLGTVTFDNDCISAITYNKIKRSCTFHPKKGQYYKLVTNEGKEDTFGGYPAYTYVRFS